MDILSKLNEIGCEKVTENNEIPDRDLILDLLDASIVLLFPRFYRFKKYSQEGCLSFIEEHMANQLRVAFQFHNAKPNMEIEAYVHAYLEALPNIKEVLLTDVDAIYLGDPAAFNRAEVILTYPGFYAIMIYRLAHVLNDLGVPYIPRVFTEYAHSKTGIDIHPGATIGSYFCIDHGTGVVIGETAHLGDHVKLYQGVTIGAKSFELDENGNPMKGGKRHPDIGNDVIIYANATILGGDTYVGDHSVIGGSVWLTHSVPEGTTLYYINKND
ncbi:MAG: serine acetyltransferase [Solobacterium sp.]|nr:serine acetyltransferase [Solobacterium sp.]